MSKSSLFRKMAVPIVIIFTLGIVLLALYIPYQMKNNVVDSTIVSAQQTVNQFKTLRKYYTQNIIKKVLGSKILRPAIDHRDNPQAVPLPATMIHDLSSLLEQEGTILRLYSAFPFPNRKSRQLDDFQSRAWAELTKNPDAVFVDQIEENGQTKVRVAVSDRMVAEACVNCHNSHPQTPKRDWNMGDVRGVLEVVTDIDKQLVAGQDSSNRITAALVLLLVALMSVIFVTYRTTIGRKLQQLDDRMSELAKGEGDLTTRLEVKGHDEIATLSDNFNTFISKIQEIISHVANTSGQVAGTAENLSQSMTQSRARVDRQSSETSQSATAMTQMSATIQEVARNASEASEAANQADQSTLQANSVVQSTVSSIEALASEVEKVFDVIRNLESHSESIGSVVDVITGIAAQTNLLALNAAIEAARAGEQGRGFAVVADEVRSLASRTQKSTEEIRITIEQLQKGTIGAVRAMEEGRSKAAASVEKAAEASESLEVVTSAVNAISGLNAQIAAAAEEQTSVAQEIEESLVVISSVAEEAAEGTNTTASTSAELARLAANLDQLVGRFKT